MKIVFYILAITTLISCSDKVSVEPSIHTVVTFSKEHHAFGDGINTRKITRSYTLPEDVSKYKRVIMNASLECPEGGCDPWDRFAQISVIKSNETVEIARLITPYGVGCSWEIDVSDYRFLLTGDVEIYSFIDTWVNPGWLLSIEFTYFEGISEFESIEVENLWVDYNVLYGDPLDPSLMPDFSKSFSHDLKKANLRILNTGHGQGNAAEFYEVTHKVLIDDTHQFDHHLWRDNCGSNNCSPQNGNWQYPRAGWCPGANVIPMNFDLSSLIGTNSSIEYQLDEYENTCRPDNEDCDGSTCAIGDDCNYNSLGHTKPHYKIAVQLISYK